MHNNIFLDYTKTVREVSLIKKAKDLRLEDVPKTMDACIVSSVCNEASVELISEIFSQNQDALLLKLLKELFYLSIQVLHQSIRIYFYIQGI
jgi:hypothetical protein